MPSDYYQAYVPLDYMDESMIDLPRVAEQRDAEHLPSNSLWGHKFMQGMLKFIMQGIHIINASHKIECYESIIFSNHVGQHINILLYIWLHENINLLVGYILI